MWKQTVENQETEESKMGIKTNCEKFQEGKSNLRKTKVSGR